jgi:hypothetical protein
LYLARAAHQDFHASFGFFKLLTARVAQLHAALEEFDGALKGEFAAFHLFHNRFQLLQADLESERRFIRHRYILTARGWQDGKLKGLVKKAEEELAADERR